MPRSPRRAPWVVPTLLVLLVGLPILEVWLLIRVGHAIGGLTTVAILIAEALFGGWLMRREGSRAWRALVEAVHRGALPVDEAADAALVLIGGVLLLLPGFVTDVIGWSSCCRSPGRWPVGWSPHWSLAAPAISRHLHRHPQPGQHRR